MKSLTSQEMKDIVNRGESVFFRTADGGLRIVNRIDAVPSDDEIARANSEHLRRLSEAAGSDPALKADLDRQMKEADARHAQALDAKQAEIDRLQAQINALKQPVPAPAPAPVPAPAPAPAPAPKAEVKK